MQKVEHRALKLSNQFLSQDFHPLKVHPRFPMTAVKLIKTIFILDVNQLSSVVRGTVLLWLSTGQM